jgi:branched-chain amino acid transport system ATP-binding protein
MDNILTLKDVTKTFGGLTALNNVTLTAQQGLVNMLIGPNGSGKTTLINCVTGFYKPDTGTIMYNGDEITGLQPHKIYDLGLVRTFQIPQPFQNLTVLENLLTAYRDHPGESFLRAPVRNTWKDTEEQATETAWQFLELLNLDHLWDQSASVLSGGQMKLVEAGRAIMSGAKMILMDEPAAGIFPKLAHEVFHYLTEMKENYGISFLIVEHRIDLILPYVDYAYCLANGQLICEGLPREVLQDELVIDCYLGE